LIKNYCKNKKFDDVEVIKEAFKQAMGRMPDTDEDVTALVASFRAGIRKNFAGTPDYASIVQLPRLMAAELVRDDADLRDDSKVPFVSQDGVTPLVPGTYVQFFNNEDGISVGRVVRLIAGSGKGGNYKDTVAVKFADQTVPNLQTRNMKPLTDDELDLTVLDNDNLLTPYVPQLQGEEMVRVRLGIDYRDSLNRKEDSPDGGPDDILESGDAAAPYIGEAGVEGGELQEDLMNLRTASTTELLKALRKSEGDISGSFAGPMIRSELNRRGEKIPDTVAAKDLIPGDTIPDAEGTDDFRKRVVSVKQLPPVDGEKPKVSITIKGAEGGKTRLTVVVDADLEIGLGTPFDADANVLWENPDKGGGTKAEDLNEGDPIYDEAGNLLGDITAIERVPSAEGGEDGYAITYKNPDGEEEVVVLDAGEVRSPK
jgi:hypothetical protein